MKETKSRYEIWKQKAHIVIYGTNTPAGRWFDICILILILLSILVVMLESVEEIDRKYHDILLITEWIITILFTIEYFMRIITMKNPWKYILSFYGIIDLVAILPMYLSYFVTGTHVLATVRSLRLLRVFRIMKLMRFIGEASQLRTALKASRTKIAVFLYAVLIISVVIGSLMFVIEGEENGFTSIPRSIYWTIVTLTTVGYGDIAPQTELGQFIAVFIMILGYGIIAVPTGIVTVEYAKSRPQESDKTILQEESPKICNQCNTENYNTKARYCYHCGNPLFLPERDVREP
ncbi:ion transporter [Sinomicrobium kalidii]|uniref:ion transporter n=1 Tax=Sinomicrobium kalidii TaxID=2900738 RepID=UPI001E6208E5|nr:ion transporter [Sinomicrobium kalidii]UGU16224.1 ion transporter [Sinomicrobium kalidii]